MECRWMNLWGILSRRRRGAERFLPVWRVLRYSSLMQLRLKDKWVVITGASSGFGAAAARAFGAEGANLLIGARRVERLEQVAADARVAGAAEAQFHFLDVCKTDSVNSFTDWARGKTGGKLDVLINNAGGA